MPVLANVSHAYALSLCRTDLEKGRGECWTQCDGPLPNCVRAPRLIRGRSLTVAQPRGSYRGQPFHPEYSWAPVWGKKSEVWVAWSRKVLVPTSHLGSAVPKVLPTTSLWYAWAQHAHLTTPPPRPPTRV